MSSTDQGESRTSKAAYEIKISICCNSDAVSSAMLSGRMEASRRAFCILS